MEMTLQRFPKSKQRGRVFDPISTSPSVMTDIRTEAKSLSNCSQPRTIPGTGPSCGLLGASTLSSCGRECLGPECRYRWVIKAFTGIQSCASQIYLVPILNPPHIRTPQQFQLVSFLDKFTRGRFFKTEDSLYQCSYS